jgi:hypothetical protein
MWCSQEIDPPVLQLGWWRQQAKNKHPYGRHQFALVSTAPLQDIKGVWGVIVSTAFKKQSRSLLLGLKIECKCIRYQ